VSDEKREGLVWLGFNLQTGAVVSDILARLRPALAQMPDWQAPDQATKLAAGRGWSAATLDARVRPMLDQQMRDSMEPFLRAMRRRLERDRNRVHAYHDDLRNTSLKRLAALARAEGDRAQADRRREMLRVEAIEREYRAKLDDLRHHYALRVTVEWVQALDLYVPVQRFDVLIRRRKGERVVHLDWHPLVKAAEPPLCEEGITQKEIERAFLDAAVVDQFTIAPDFLPTAIGHFLALGHQTGAMPPFGAGTFPGSRRCLFGSASTDERSGAARHHRGRSRNWRRCIRTPVGG
jgi:hypothetical protein